MVTMGCMVLLVGFNMIQWEYTWSTKSLRTEHMATLEFVDFPLEDGDSNQFANFYSYVPLCTRE